MIEVGFMNAPIENFTELVVALDAAGLPEYMPVLCQQLARSGQRRFYLPQVTVSAQGAAFTRACFIMEGATCAYLGLGVRVMPGYRLSEKSPINTLTLHRALEVIYCPTRYPGKLSDEDKVLRATVRTQAREILHALSVTDPELYAKMVAGFDLKVKLSPLRQKRLYELGQLEARTCWFEAAAGVTRDQAVTLMENPGIAHAILKRTGSPLGKGDHWIQTYHEGDALQGPVDLHLMPADKLDVAASIRTTDGLLPLVGNMERLVAAIENGDRFEFTLPQPHGLHPVFVSADAIGQCLAFYDQKDQRISPDRLKELLKHAHQGTTAAIHRHKVPNHRHPSRLRAWLETPADERFQAKGRKR